MKYNEQFGRFRIQKNYDRMEVVVYHRNKEVYRTHMCGGLSVSEQESYAVFSIANYNYDPMGELVKDAEKWIEYEYGATLNRDEDDE